MVDRSEPQLNSLFQEVILNHYRKPRNKGTLDSPTVEVHMRNPTCGDDIRLQLALDNGKVADAKFVGEGCSISQASVSMMTGLLKDRTVDDAMALARRFTEMMHGDTEAARDKALGDLRSLAGVSKFPVRVKCALLGFDALQEALKKNGGEEES